MKKLICSLLAVGMLLAGCAGPGGETTLPTVPGTASNPTENLVNPERLDVKSSGYVLHAGETLIRLSDAGIEENAEGVFVANDIVYYEEGHDFTYGEGGPGDAHSVQEAAAHQVVHITQPGTYVITGKLSAGQIAVDLGKDAKDDPNAVVTLILDGVDITCTVAPAVIFYNVYECGSDDAVSATHVVDTSAAGANVVIAGGSVNMVNGAYVAKIYKEGTVVLDEDGDEVEDAKKLHKYDAAFYSKMSMNVDGGGILLINAENEGLGTEMHLTINGGDIRIRSGNDGINTNEDDVSVTTVNGGVLDIVVTGETGEGDGIDSNGWILVNGGVVKASACGRSMDSGLDADRGIVLNGGRVFASGNMADAVSGGDMTYALFSFDRTRSGGLVYRMKDGEGRVVLEFTPENAFTCLILGGDNLSPGEYTLWEGESQLAGSAGNGFGGFPGRPDFRPPEGDYEIPPQPSRPVEQQGARPGGDWESDAPPTMPEGETWPQGSMIPGGNPGWRPGQGNSGGVTGGEDQANAKEQVMLIFKLVKGGNMFRIAG